MLYTVQEVADKLHISKVTIYKKLKLTKLSEMTIMQNEQIMICDELIGLINDSLKTKRDFIDDDKMAVETVETEDLQVNSDELTAYKILTETLIKQLTEKDNQINDYSERLKQSLELNRNSQVLLKDKPHEDILLLEEHFQDLDSKLEEVKENMKRRKSSQKTKGFFSKIFRSTNDD